MSTAAEHPVDEAAMERLVARQDEAVAAMLESAPAARRQALKDATAAGGDAWLNCTLGAQPSLILAIFGGPEGKLRTGLVRRAADGLSPAELAYLAAARDVVNSAVRYVAPAVREQIAGGFFALATTPDTLVVTWKADPTTPSIELARFSLFGARQAGDTVH